MLRVSAVPGGRFQHALLRTRDIELTARWALSALPEGAPVSVHFHTRVIGGGGQYRFYIAIMPSGDLLATLAKAEAGASSPLAGPIQVGSGYVPGKWWHVRVQATGSTPTTLRARVWKHGSPEPATWALELADGTAGLQADSHAVQIGVYARAGARSLPIEAMFDDVSVKGSI
ncbi:MAG: hypothetical protein ABI452_01410 [Candidatus Limnocylindrales bacterium]